jgi:hypothetical protein
MNPTIRLVTTTALWALTAMTAIVLLAGPALAQIRYKDADGVTHWVDSVDRIPEKRPMAPGTVPSTLREPVTDAARKEPIRASEQSLTIVPPPVNQPAYAQVEALKQRERLCKAELETRKAALKKTAEGTFFLTEQERKVQVSAAQRALDAAEACAKDSLTELLKVALPKLDADCVKAQDRPCAQWARSQGTWLTEIESLTSESQVCKVDSELTTVDIERRADSLSGRGYTDQGTRTYEQQGRDLRLLQQDGRTLMAFVRARQAECTAKYKGRIDYLEMALAGLDPEAEVPRLLAATNRLVTRIGPELTFETFHDSLSRPVNELGEVTARRASVGRRFEEFKAIRSVVDVLIASDTAWTQGLELKVKVDRLTRDRDAALADYSQRVSGGLSTAQMRLNRAMEDLNRMMQDRDREWKTAQRLVNETPQLAGHDAATGSPQSKLK